MGLDDRSAVPRAVRAPTSHAADSGSAAWQMAPQKLLPSFIIGGPPRTGTTWLYEVLRPWAVLPTHTKETRFFDLHFHRGPRWYLQHFPVPEANRPVGEIAPTYFASPAARDRVAANLPRVRMVFILRHPVERLISLYRLKCAYGMYRWSLDEAIDQDAELVSSSRYATHLRGWLACLPAQQVSVSFFDDLQADPSAFVRCLGDFLGIPGLLAGDVQIPRLHSAAGMSQPRNYHVTRAALAVADWCKAHNLDSLVAGVRENGVVRYLTAGGSAFSEVAAATRLRLAALLRDEIEQLETMVRRDLSHWKESAGNG